MFWVGVAVGGVLSGALLLWLGRPRAPAGGEEPASPAAQLTVGDDPRSRLYAMAAALAPAYDQAARPDDLLGHAGFREAVALLCSDAFTDAELANYFGGDNHLIATLAAMALAERSGDSILGLVLESINASNYYARDFALRALEAREDQPLLAPILDRVEASWSAPFATRVLQDFVRRRRAAGDPDPGPEPISKWPPEKVEWLVGVLEQIDENELAANIRGTQGARVDVDYLRTVGKVWEVPEIGEVVRDAALERRLGELRRLLGGSSGRSTLLIGESGTGKSVALEVVAAELIADGWTVFEAGAVEILAGQSYLGQVEQRMQDLLRAIAEKPGVLWVVPALEEMQWAGRHQYSMTSLLDVLLPFVETGKVRIVGELQPAAWERLVQTKPAVRGAFEALTFEPLGDDDTLALLKAWSRQVVPAGAPPLLDDGLAGQAFSLAQQFLGATAQPGNVLGFVARAREVKRGGEDAPPAALTVDDLLATLGRLTGLPRAILDDREGLDLASLERHFHERVVGQPEAVSCLVERVAMIKAGLTDPTRPQGVFLFTGPTGTGKTEIAKTLASYLFGSTERMLRLDMSEFQGFESLDRLLGGADERDRNEALVHQIRKQPFAVLLLDEVEKAHPKIWDLFLQVFDDGRLTDRRGRLADFRHAIIVMTSNLGSDALRGAGMGFRSVPTATGLDVGVERSLREVFRPEFLNRIDRIVVFRSLSRADMQRVLEKELRLVLGRRGLRNRQWAVEWDESALGFFLDRGFTAELGARPLRRTIERFLLAPLARTIVNQKAPTGDQFLFVRSDGRGIQVEFVDPDAPQGEEVRESAAPAGAVPASLGSIALEPAGSRAEADFLIAVHRELGGLVRDDAWSTRKQAALDAMADPDFWQRDDRFTILGRAEYMDRIGVGLDTADKLLHRLLGSEPSSRTAFSREVVRRLAEQLHLLRAAVDGFENGRPADAWLRVESLHDPRVDVEAVDGFAHAVAAMYRRWGRRRRMDTDVLRESGGDGDRPYRALLALGGFGAFTLLGGESGLHVLEQPGANDQTDRLRVRVTVAGQPDDAPREDPNVRIERARDALGGVEIDPTRIVRRYRRDPSPLVRDAVRGWRTGRLDRVLDGDFDLFG